ncbi:tetratricopeptide repeat protein [Streptomyces sp. NPDC060085]|uniref:tetratricopeptide repeat protein n=1 Tax=Streptomyces sp. NPDC060085 TaxID=3347054 RepID=UPI0036504D6B
MITTENDDHQKLQALIRGAQNTPEGMQTRLLAQRDLADLWRRRGEYRRAGLLFAFTLQAAERVEMPDGPLVASICNQWGILGKYTGRFDQSEELYLRALTVYEQKHTTDCDEIATICHNLGGLAHARGASEVGEPWAARSVAVRERLHGPDHLLTAADRAAWAALLDGCGRYDDAETQLCAAVDVFRRADGDQRYEIAVNQHNLAALYHRRGQCAKAIDGYREALVAKETLLGTKHPGLATTLAGLAAAQLRQNSHRSAVLNYERAIAILTDHQVEAAHPVLRAAQHGLAVALQETSIPQTAGQSSQQLL